MSAALETLEFERALDAVERQGYEALTRWMVPADVAPLPDYISELGANLLSSCPATGVLATGNDLETVAIFSVVATAGAAGPGNSIGAFLGGAWLTNKVGCMIPSRIT